MVDFAKPIEQAKSCENHSRILTSKRYFLNFLLKANQQFVEILPTTYIFQSCSIYNISSKVVRSIKEHYDQYIMICK